MDSGPAFLVADEDDLVERRVERAAAAAWNERAPSCRRVPTSGRERADGSERDGTLPPAVDVCGLVVAASALTGRDVTPEIGEWATTVPTVAVVREPDPGRVREAFRNGADDVVDASAADEAFAERLREVFDPGDAVDADPALDRLEETVLDSATTLMSAELDEIGTKIEWTLESVGEQAGLDAVVAYTDAADAYEPAYAWCPGERRPEPRSFDAFPSPSALSTFANVVRSHDPAGRCPDGQETTAEPPATVHVPLVSEWDLVGVVAFEADGPRCWRDEEVDLFRTLADLIAHTIARERRQGELRRQAQQLEQFSSVVSHDLRNPLNVLSGYLDVAADDIAEAQYRPMVDALDRMDTLVSDLLMLAKRGQTIGDTESVPLADVAREAWRSVRAPDASLTVADDPGYVEADPSRLQQAFENLFRNAVEHGGPTVEITVSAHRRDGEVTGIVVRDDGPGIPEEACDSVFDSGFSTADGSGIGLAIVARIVEAHGWEATVENDDGARFVLAFDEETVRVSDDGVDGADDVFGGDRRLVDQ